MMNEGLKRYLSYGKTVKMGSTRYILIGDYDKASDTVRAVPEEDYRRWKLLRAWSQNNVGNTPEQAAEREGYEKDLPAGGLEFQNIVRIRKIEGLFPSNDFEVTDGGSIIVNGEERTVVWLDECHFHFLDGSDRWFGGCYHIDEFAEVRKRNGLAVSKKEGAA